MHAILFLIIVYMTIIYVTKDSPVILPIGGITIQKKSYVVCTNAESYGADT